MREMYAKLFPGMFEFLKYALTITFFSKTSGRFNNVSEFQLSMFVVETLNCVRVT